MKKLSIIVFFALIASLATMYSCDHIVDNAADNITQEQSEKVASEARKQVGMPAIKNFTELKTLAWIYELRDRENLLCYAYLADEFHGQVGQYLGKCLGYGIPYSAQFSNPYKNLHDGVPRLSYPNTLMPQAEPNMIFMPTSFSATWLIMFDPDTDEPKAIYIEPKIIVSPFKLHSGDES